MGQSSREWHLSGSLCHRSGRSMSPSEAVSMSERSTEAGGKGEPRWQCQGPRFRHRTPRTVAPPSGGSSSIFCRTLWPRDAPCRKCQQLPKISDVKGDILLRGGGLLFLYAQASQEQGVHVRKGVYSPTKMSAMVDKRIGGSAKERILRVRLT